MGNLWPYPQDKGNRAWAIQLQLSPGAWTCTSDAQRLPGVSHWHHIPGKGAVFHPPNWKHMVNLAPGPTASFLSLQELPCSSRSPKELQHFFFSLVEIEDLGWDTTHDFEFFNSVNPSLWALWLRVSHDIPWIPGLRSKGKAGSMAMWSLPSSLVSSCLPTVRKQWKCPVLYTSQNISSIIKKWLPCQNSFSNHL